MEKVYQRREEIIVLRRMGPIAAFIMIVGIISRFSPNANNIRFLLSGFIIVSFVYFAVMIINNRILMRREGKLLKAKKRLLGDTRCLEAIHKIIGGIREINSADKFAEYINSFVLDYDDDRLFKFVATLLYCGDDVEAIKQVVVYHLLMVTEERNLRVSENQKFIHDHPLPRSYDKWAKKFGVGNNMFRTRGFIN
jgi:hypothetical protein